jgi:gamma-glutamylcyclotransferase (GGCT)/AIG2-like uncharacterized protein YtfP
VTPLHGAAGTFRLFVYGTLKRGGVRNVVLSHQRYLGEARTTPRYALYHLGEYPGLAACAEDGLAVQGELYEVECVLLDRLDAVEGAPALFQLEPVEVHGQAGPGWAYFYKHDVTGQPRIASGRWDNPAKGSGP